MPRRRIRSTSPADMFTADDDDDSLNNDDASQTSNDRCPPQQRNAANARERARMRVLSKAFCRLKTTLPWVPADTKLSKLDTLRLASGYIAHLRALLADQPSEELHHTGRPLNLTWPFTFQQGIGGSWVGSDRAPPAPLSPQCPLQSQGPQGAPPHGQGLGCDSNSNIYSNNNFFTRSQQFQQNDNSDYFSQIHRDNYIRQPYNESMMHTG